MEIFNEIQWDFSGRSVSKYLILRFTEVTKTLEILWLPKPISYVSPTCGWNVNTKSYIVRFVRICSFNWGKEKLKCLKKRLGDATERHLSCGFPWIVNPVMKWAILVVGQRQHFKGDLQRLPLFLFLRNHTRGCIHTKATTSFKCDTHNLSLQPWLLLFCNTSWTVEKQRIRQLLQLWGIQVSRNKGIQVVR